MQQFDWEVPDWIILPGGNLGNVSAIGKGFLMMQELGLISKLPRICVAQAENANPFYLSYLQKFDHFEPMTARKTLASAIQIGNPVSIRKAIATIERFNGVVELRSWSLPKKWRALTAPACSIARTRGGARRVAQAGRTQGDPRPRAGSRDFDGAWPQVCGPEDSLSRRYPRRSARKGNPIQSPRRVERRAKKISDAISRYVERVRLLDH